MTMTSPHPFHLLVKPVGSKCNLDCHYCYYLRKEERYQSGATMQMSDALLETYVQQYIAAQPKHIKFVDFSWQGGEPALRGLEFYERAVELQKKYARSGMTISNTFQSNGTLINEKWAKFFKKNNFLIGLSIDGDELNHDLGRPDVKGNGSYSRVLRGLSKLQKHKVQFNTLTVVHNDNAHLGKQTYQTLKKLGSNVIQFQPCVEHSLDRRGEKDWSLTPHQWGHFLCDVFDEWRKEDVGKVHIQFFENTLGILAGQPSQMCFHSETCGQQMMLEHDGSIYSCDHYSYENHKVGDIESVDLGALASSSKQVEFGLNKWKSLPKRCRECDFRPMCNGGCPKERTSLTADLEPGLNHLCFGYKKFFVHAMPYFAAMLEAIKLGHPAAVYPMFVKRITA
ncbi:anaerobic sulfatase maturase [Vibrio pomeroyi]|uniref:anaerobic sulfatase maturase n=1 Tax=Vibrio pomeroyi TaxID=198832 RepID=UPI0021C37063|nr:anaerobic sulfatase maturase [Vibrio pomeroyi]